MPAACFDCEHGGQEFPCRTNGAFDAAKMAQVYMDEVVRKDGGEGGSHWSFSCIDDVCKEAPEDALRFIQETLPLLKTNLDAAVFAAGPLEVLIADSGAYVIDQIETWARQSPRFRFFADRCLALGQRRNRDLGTCRESAQGRRAYRPRPDAACLTQRALR